MRDKLVTLILESEILCNTCGENAPSYCAEAIVDLLIANLDKKVYYIIDKRTPYAFVSNKKINELCLFELMDLNKYGYYLSQEEAEEHLKFDKE